MKNIKKESINSWIEYFKNIQEKIERVKKEYGWDQESGTFAHERVIKPK